MKKLTFLFIICIGLLIGCGKDKTTTKTENPVKLALASKVAIDSVNGFEIPGSFEQGNKIYFSKAGTVTKLGCRMYNKGTYTVTLWDFTTKNLIASTTVTVSDSTQFSYNSISPVSIVANTRYVISVNTSSGAGPKGYWLFFKKTSPGVISTNIYPFTSGSVTYEDFREKATSTTAFPDASSAFGQRFVAGVPDLQFEYTE